MKEAQAQAAPEPVGHMRQDLLYLVDRFADTSVLVVGDAIVDEYHFGSIKRISPEAPVPVFVEDDGKREVRRGGADNVAHQLEVLGCKTHTHFPNRRSEKHRYMVGHYQVFRRDRDEYEEGTFPWQYEPPDANVIVLSDYAKGFLTFELCRLLITMANDYRIPVIVDPKARNWEKYRGATLICPNSKELDEGIGPKFNTVIEKRGADGLRIWQDGKYEDIPAAARHVFDVTGAGDTVVAVVAAAIGAGGDVASAARLAAYAAGYVVGEVGTAVCPVEKLRSLIIE